MQTPQFITRFLAGIVSPLRGLQALAKWRSLWALAAFPLFLGLIWTNIALIQRLLTPEGVGWLSKIGSIIVESTILITAVVMNILIALCAPLFDLIGEQTEIESGIQPESPPFLQLIFSLNFWLRVTRSIWEAIKLLGFKLLLILLSLPIGLVPGVGVYISAILSGLATGVDFIDYPLARRDQPLRAKVLWLKQNWPQSLGLSISVFALIQIPAIGGLSLVPCVIGGTLLFIDTLPEDAP